MQSLQPSSSQVRAITERLTTAIDHCDGSKSLWRELQSLHRLSQPFWLCHAKVHFLMLRYALKVGAKAEILVQLAFIFGAVPSSIFRFFPPGHPGTVTISVR